MPPRGDGAKPAFTCLSLLFVSCFKQDRRRRARTGKPDDLATRKDAPTLAVSSHPRFSLSTEYKARRGPGSSAELPCWRAGWLAHQYCTRTEYLGAMLPGHKSSTGTMMIGKSWAGRMNNRPQTEHVHGANADTHTQAVYGSIGHSWPRMKTSSAVRPQFPRPRPARRDLGRVRYPRPPTALPRCRAHRVLTT